MIRILLAAEGKTDELVAGALVEYAFAECQIQPKHFPSRGFASVLKFAPLVVRAAHYQLFDIVVIHFDLDSTLRHQDIRNMDVEQLKQSPRWQEFNEAYAKEASLLKEIPARTRRLRCILMTPHQSIEAWLAWGEAGGDGHCFEMMPRKTLKKGLFGDCPFPKEERIAELVRMLINRMGTEPRWPFTLRCFVDQLRDYIP